MLHKQSTSILCALALLAGCGKDKEQLPAGETSGIPVAVAGRYQLAESTHARPLETRLYVTVSAAEATVSSLPSDSSAKSPGARLLGEPVKLTDLAARLDQLVTGEAAARTEVAEESTDREEVAEPTADEDEEPGGTGSKMALEDGKMGSRESDRQSGRYAMQERNVDPQLARKQAMEKALEAGLVGEMRGDSFARLTGTSDFSSGLDDRALSGATVAGPAGGQLFLDARLRAQTISEHAPLIVADRNLKAARLVEIVGALCHHGARLGVAVKGSPSAAEHVVKLGALVSSACPEPAVEPNPPAAAPESRRRVLLELLEVGYDLRSGEERSTVERGDTAGLTKALSSQRAEADRPLELWIVTGDAATVSDLVRALDAAAAAKIETVHVAGIEALYPKGGFGTVAAPGSGEANGARGFGDPGPGPGSDKSGWGTIGAGRYGTFGSPPEGDEKPEKKPARENRRRPPQVRIGNATATGDLDKAIIRRYIRRKLPRIKYCYERQLLVKPSLKGTVVTNFQIAPSGSVVGSSAKGVNEKVSSCVAREISRIQFPKPKGGGMVQVRYPFEFRPFGE